MTYTRDERREHNHVRYTFAFSAVQHCLCCCCCWPLLVLQASVARAPHAGRVSSTRMCVCVSDPLFLCCLGCGHGGLLRGKGTGLSNRRQKKTACRKRAAPRRRHRGPRAAGERDTHSTERHNSAEHGASDLGAAAARVPGATTRRRTVPRSAPSGFSAASAQLPDAQRSVQPCFAQLTCLRTLLLTQIPFIPSVRHVWSLSSTALRARVRRSQRRIHPCGDER
jgi:hypothetical protein